MSKLLAQPPSFAVPKQLGVTRGIGLLHGNTRGFRDDDGIRAGSTRSAIGWDARGTRHHVPGIDDFTALMSRLGNGTRTSCPAAEEREDVRESGKRDRLQQHEPLLDHNSRGTAALPLRHARARGAQKLARVSCSTPDLEARQDAVAVRERLRRATARAGSISNSIPHLHVPVRAGSSLNRPASPSAETPADAPTIMRQTRSR